MIRCAIIAVTLTLAAAAQQQPAGPRIRLSPPAAAKYSVTLRKSAPAKQDQPDPRKPNIATDTGDAGNDQRSTIEVEITGDTARATTREADGKTSEVYMFRQLFLRLDTSTNKVRPYKFDPYAPAEMRFTHSFPGIDWVQPAMFKGKVERDGRSCLYFVQEAGTGDKAPLNPDDKLAYDNRHAASRREAWFDATSGLPVVFKEAGLEGSYHHSAPPKEAVQLPPPYLAAVRHYYGQD